jgi:hypothetical protein
MQQLEETDLPQRISRLKAELKEGGYLHQTAFSSAAIVEANSATGTVFEGGCFRSFLVDRRLQAQNWEQPIHNDTTKGRYLHSKNTCMKWGDAATIYDPSLAIVRAADMDGWCLVVVASIRTPKDYIQKAGLEAKNATVVFLSVENQHQWMKETDEVGDFHVLILSSTSLGSIWGSSISTPFAMVPSSSLTSTMETLLTRGKVVPIIPNEMMVEKARVILVGPSVFNPYPLMSSSITTNSWPRCFPLELIQIKSTQGTVVFEKDVPIDEVGVIQVELTQIPTSTLFVTW